MAHELVVIGSSKGGARTLPRLLADLPAGFPAAVAAVQHRGLEMELGGLASFLRERGLASPADLRGKMAPYPTPPVEPEP